MDYFSDSTNFSSHDEQLKPQAGPSLDELLLKEYDNRSKEKSSSLMKRAKNIVTAIREKGISGFLKERRITPSSEQEQDEESKKKNELDKQRRVIKLQQRFFEVIETLDIIDASKILEAFSEDNLTPAETQYFLALFHELKKRQNRAHAVLSRLRRQAEKKLKINSEESQENKEKIDLEIARLAFKLMTWRYPIEAPRLINSKFAVGLKINDKADLGALYTDSSNVPGGFYDDQRLSLLLFANFPLLVVGPVVKFTPEGTEKHETGHGINKAIHNALIGIGLADTWSSENFEVNRNKHTKKARSGINEIIQSSKKNKSSAELTQAMKEALVHILPDQLSRVKDELTTDFNAYENFSFLTSVKLSDHKELIHEYYNGFSAAGFDKNLFSSSLLAEVYDNFVQEYNSLLEASVYPLAKIWNVWSKLGMKNRKTELLEFMRTTPFHLWNKKSNDLYQEDVSKLQALLNSAEKALHETDELKRFIAAISEMRDRIKNELLTARSYLPDLQAKVEQEFEHISQEVDNITSSIDLNFFYRKFSDLEKKTTLDPAFDTAKLEEFRVMDFKDTIDEITDVLYLLKKKLKDFEKELMQGNRVA